LQNAAIRPIVIRNSSFVREAVSVIVCVCNALRDRQVRAAGRALQSTCPRTAYAHLGCKPKCGQCLPYAREVLSNTTR
jgi:bacterioferritin-associated ferredoxin